jgi:hypothetical protein
VKREHLSGEEEEMEWKTARMISHLSCDARTLFVGFEDGQVELYDAEGFSRIY